MLVKLSPGIKKFSPIFYVLVQGFINPCYANSRLPDNAKNSDVIYDYNFLKT